MNWHELNALIAEFLMTKSPKRQRVNRETIQKSNSKQTQEASYYVSNYNDSISENVSAELTKAIRKHWSVESNNWQSDVTFNEDNVRVSDGN